ncbi:hypothetical protein ASPSYDRAFT_271004 [Aspergillus sydowii CBS 593.65]|uniref:Uncharacterized protein n=1 Tax=Aspergillus sydowii CBS 593.65 TaxID=1036612 RepID=A0A1L9TWV3_9EURO|nr:uncharacterized protein ASPSYDRAFT_271004 [Aspergillus sydowii CBS 593.65]OJJ63848.1 hypothetical protein ASPSYDRAFT_271004 [Aspergillus sydowii CBS 593.65]
MSLSTNADLSVEPNFHHFRRHRAITAVLMSAFVIGGSVFNLMEEKAGASSPHVYEQVRGSQSKRNDDRPLISSNLQGC